MIPLKQEKKNLHYKNRKTGVMVLEKDMKSNSFFPTVGVWFHVKILELEVEIES